MTKYLFAFALLFSGLFAVKATAADLGPAIGTQIGQDIDATDQYGTMQTFKSLTGKKGSVLVFYRSAKWCPYCQIQLKKLEKNAAERIRTQGYNLIGISYDHQKELIKFSKKHKISYPLLADTGSKIIKSFGILNEKYQPGHSTYGIPHPIIIITDEHGIVTAKLYEDGYKKRPQADVILKALKDLS